MATGVDNLRSWAGNKPLFAFIETTGYNGGTGPTPAQIRAETWLALIHGANGTEYFCHIFSPQFIEAGCFTLSSVVAQLKTDDAQISSLAPVLNSDTVPHGGGPASFTLPGGGNETVTVVGENRTLPMSGGTFSDSFGAYGVHIYQIAGA